MPYKRLKQAKRKQTTPAFGGYYPYVYGGSLGMSVPSSDSGEGDSDMSEAAEDDELIDDPELMPTYDDVPDEDIEAELPEISRRTVPGARLVNSTLRTDGLVEELWLVIDKKNSIKQNVVNTIVAGTDIDPETRQGKETGCGVVLWRRGNVQFIQVVCSPVVDFEDEDI